MSKSLYGFYHQNAYLSEFCKEREGEKITAQKTSKTSKQSNDLLPRLWRWKPKEDFLVYRLLREWSLHGVKYIFQIDRHISERLFWAVAVACCIAAGVLLSNDIVQKYYRSPVIVSFEPAQTRTEQIPFPAVTVCNVNQFIKSEYLKTRSYLEEAIKNNVNISESEELQDNLLIMRQLQHVCSATASFSTKFNFSLDETTVQFSDGIKKLLKQHPIPVAEIYKPENLLTFIKAMQLCPDMIKLCVWEGMPFDCSEHFRMIVTDVGLCCTFNMMPNRVLVRISDNDTGHMNMEDEGMDQEEVDQWKRYSVDEKVMITNYYDEVMKNITDSFPLRQTIPGQDLGLSILLAPETENYYCTSHNGYGFKIVTHSSIETPHVKEFGMAVGPNTEMFINLEAELTLADDKLKVFSSDERKCYFEKDRELKNFYRYSASNCVDECITNKTISDCGCILFDMVQTPINKTRICDTFENHCPFGIKRHVQLNGAETLCPKCYQSCVNIFYEAKTSYAPIRDDVNIWNPPTDTSEEGKASTTDLEDWSGKNMSVVHIFFGAEPVHTKIRRPFYGTNDLFASIGGIIGLFTGASVITLVEPVYFTMRLIVNTVLKK